MSLDSMREEWYCQRQSLSCIFWLQLYLPMIESWDVIQHRLFFTSMCTVQECQQVIAMRQENDIRLLLEVLMLHLSIFDSLRQKKWQPFDRLEFLWSLDQQSCCQLFALYWVNCSYGKSYLMNNLIIRKIHWKQIFLSKKPHYFVSEIGRTSGFGMSHWLCIQWAWSVSDRVDQLSGRKFFQFVQLIEVSISRSLRASECIVCIKVKKRFWISRDIPIMVASQSWILVFCCAITRNWFCFPEKCQTLNQ